MALQVWLPLNGNLDNQGLADVSVTSGTAKYKTGKIGNGLDLSSRVMFNCPDLTGLKRFTIMFWVKIEDDDSITSNWQDIFGTYEQKADGSSYGQFRAETCYATESASLLGVHWHDNTNYGITSGTLPTHYTGDRGIWHHCAIVVDSDQFIKSYTDGVLKNEYTTGLEAGHLYNGTFWLGETDKIAGCVNDVRIYDNCLSSREVKEISKGLVLHYPLSMPGQENLVKQSNQFRVGGHAAKITPSLLEDGTYQVIAESGNSNYTSSWWMTMDGVENDFVEDEVFTVSFTIKSSDADTTTPPRIYLKSGMGYFPMIGKVTESWSTVYYTGLWKKENSLSPHLGWSGLVGTYQILNWKIEKGSRPTLWIPNHADPLYSSLGFNDGIEYDVSGYGHNGTKYGTLTYSSDTPRYNTSTVFNGTDNCIKFPFNDFCTNGDVFTMNIWWEKTVLGSKAYETLIGGPSGFEMDTRSGSAQTLSLYMATTRGGNVYSPFNMNEWYMVTLVNDGTNELYYVNGTLVKTIEKKNMPSGNYYVGAWKNETGQNFNGFMSDFRFYKTALSSDDVLELYHTSASLADNGTLMAYEFNEV